MASETHHVTVLLNEAVDQLQVKPDHWYVDATFGRGGHTKAILARGGRVIAFDVDQEAIEYGEQVFASEIEQGQLYLIRSNFEYLQAETTKIGHTISGILFDFGTSTNQLMSENRGFSFNSASALDMRMDQRLGVTALDLLNVLPEKQLVELFQSVGGEREARAIAKAIKRKQAMQQGLLKINAQQLADLIVQAKHEPHSKLHPATKVFQALRIAVNQELDSISQALPQALSLLSSGGRIVTIAFHEGEDRIVKQYFRSWAHAHKGQEIIRTEPTAAEIADNPRARSARMRVFEV